jgi:hypothetical protein
MNNNTIAGSVLAGVIACKVAALVVDMVLTGRCVALERRTVKVTVPVATRTLTVRRTSAAYEPFNTTSQERHL